MVTLKCKMCGGELQITEDTSVCECEYCGSKQTIPTVDDEKLMKLYDRANRLRMSNEFDKAAGVYESIIEESDTEAEAYWGLLLCKYGIEYVDDPASGDKVPTCHRSSFDSILEDPDFEMVMENSDALARSVYRESAKQIEEIRKGIIEVSGKEEPYDIFICYKETAEDGDRTVDSVMAQDVYDALTGKGYRVFFSRISLEDKLGTEYEPYIFAALNSAKIMLAFGTSYDYYNAVWVKNEWSRYLKLMAKDKEKHLIPCYKDIDAYDMPKEFKHLQAQDMGKVGAVQDLLRGIDKILRPEGVTSTSNTSEQDIQSVVANAIAANANSNLNALLQRGYMALADENWENAKDFFENALNHDANCVDAYLGKLLADLKVTSKDNLKIEGMPFDKNENYKKILHVGKIEDIDYINECNDYIKKRIIYEEAVAKEKNKQYIEAEKIYKSIEQFEDAKEKAKECEEVLAEQRKQMELYGEECVKYESDVDYIVGEINKSIACASNIKKKTTIESEKKSTMNHIDVLKRLEDRYPLLEVELEKNLKLKLELESRKANLEFEQEKLGIFGKKRYLQIQSELSEIVVQLDKTQKYIDQIKQDMKGYTKESLNKKINDLLEHIQNMDREILSLTESSKGEIKEKSLKEINDKLQDPRICNVFRRKNPGLYFMYRNSMLDKEPKIGDKVTLGNYENDPIEWRILDKKDGRLLLMSDKAVDGIQYNITEEETWWEKSSLRRWLNGNFIFKAFDECEHQMVEMTHVRAERNPEYNLYPGENTDDKVFCLSISEAQTLLKLNDEQICYVSEAAKKSKMYYIKEEEKNSSRIGRCEWWLRTSAYSHKYAAKVDIIGGISNYGERADEWLGVRPVIWIDYTKQVLVNNEVEDTFINYIIDEYKVKNEKNMAISFYCYQTGKTLLESERAVDAIWDGTYKLKNRIFDLLNTNGELTMVEIAEKLQGYSMFEIGQRLEQLIDKHSVTKKQNEEGKVVFSICVQEEAEQESDSQSQSKDLFVNYIRENFLPKNLKNPAIKWYRVQTGAGLNEAKKIIGEIWGDN